MKTVRDKMIKEMIPIERCQKDDHIYIKKGIRSEYNYGSMIIVKVKPLPKGRVQIKYKGTYKTSTVQKGVIPVGTMVERTRKWTKDDGPDAGYIPPETKLINGILYTVTPDGKPQSVVHNKDSLSEESLDPFVLTNNEFDKAMMTDALMSMGLGSLLVGTGISVSRSSPSPLWHEPDLSSMKTVDASSQKKLT